MNNKRPTINEYFMDMTKLISKRSTCLSRNVGAIAVKNKHIVATGYNGQISGAEHCKECLRKKIQGTGKGLIESCRAVHAEMNIVCQAAYHGKSLKGCTVYLPIKPCNTCFKLLANSGVKKIIFLEDYPDNLTNRLIIESRFYPYKIIENDKEYLVISRDHDEWMKDFANHITKNWNVEYYE